MALYGNGLTGRPHDAMRSFDGGSALVGTLRILNLPVYSPVRLNPSSSESLHASLVSTVRGASNVGSTWAPVSGELKAPSRAPERRAANDTGGSGDAGEEEKAGVTRARHGGLVVPARSNGSSEGEGGRTLERSISGGSGLTLVDVRFGRDEALRLTGLGVARGVSMTSRGGVDFKVGEWDLLRD